jgi:hypothetical protein
LFLQFCGRLPSPSKVAFDRVKGLRLEIRAYQLGDTFYFLLESKLAQPSTTPIIASVHSVGLPEAELYFNVVMERYILDCSTNGEINDLFLKIFMQNKKVSAKALRHRPSLMDEADELRIIRNSQDPERMSKLKHVKKFFFKPADEGKPYYRWYWSTNGQEDPLLTKKLGF